MNLSKYFKIEHTRYFSGDLGRFRRRSSRFARCVRKIYSNRLMFNRLIRTKHSLCSDLSISGRRTLMIRFPNATPRRIIKYRDAVIESSSPVSSDFESCEIVCVSVILKFVSFASSCILLFDIFYKKIHRKCTASTPSLVSIVCEIIRYIVVIGEYRSEFSF